MFRHALAKIKRVILRKKKEFEDFAWLISVLDNFRAGKRVKRGMLREKARNVHRNFDIPSLSRIYDDLEYIKGIAIEKEPKMELYAKILFFTQFVIRQAFLIIFFVGLIMVISFRFWLTQEEMKIILYVIIIIAWIVVFIRWYVRDKTIQVYKKYYDMYKKNQERVGEFVQELINLMGKKLKERNESAKKYNLLLYHKNYDNIKVKREPGFFFGEYYVCNVDMDGIEKQNEEEK